MTEQERYKLMASEARFERKRGLNSFLKSGVAHIRFRYFQLRKGRNALGQRMSDEEYNLRRALYGSGRR